MKPSKEQIEAIEKLGVYVDVDEAITLITFYDKHGGEHQVDIPHGCKMSEFLRLEYDNYDVSYETYVWLDNSGHGKDGAPDKMEDVLSDMKEWEKKLDELATEAYDLGL